MEAQRNKGLHLHDNRGMTKSHSSTSSLSSIPRLPPIDSAGLKQLSEDGMEEMKSRLNRLLEVGKSDIMLSTSKVVEQARLAESKITSRLDSLSLDMLSAADNVIREKENEIAEMRVQCGELENRAGQMLERERGLVEQQSQLSIELVMEKRGRQTAELQLSELGLLVAELRVKLEESFQRENEKRESDLKTKDELNGKMKDHKTEIMNLQKQLDEEQEMRKKEISKQDANSKHSKENMRLHQDVNKWKMKCEKTLEETQNLKKGIKSKEEELRQEKLSWEEKFKHENSQHKEEVKALQAKLSELDIIRGAEVSSREGIIQKFQNDLEHLKEIYNEALQQIDMLKKNLEEYENPQENVMESSRVRLLRAQNQREKAKLEYERREASRKINRSVLQNPNN